MIEHLLGRAFVISALVIGVMLFGCTSTPTVTENQTDTKSANPEIPTSIMLAEETIIIDTPEFSAQLPSGVIWEEKPLKKDERYIWSGVSKDKQKYGYNIWTGVTIRQKNEYSAEVDLDYHSIPPDHTFMDSVSSWQYALIKYLVSTYDVKLISNKHRTISSGTDLCLEYDTLLDASNKVINTIGYICPSPKDKQSSIEVLYDCEYYNGHETQECRDAAYKFFKSVKLK